MVKPSNDKILQLNEFFIEGKNPNKSHVLLNITEPSTPAEKEKGYFFALCEAENSTNKYLIKMQNLIDELENSYYETDDEADRSSLEVVLDKINNESHFFIKPEVPLNCVIGILRNNNEIIFSAYGSPQIIIFHKNKQGGFQKIDLLAENTPSAEKTTKSILFEQIIQGKISENDYFFACTSRVIDYFSMDRLQKIISTRPARQSAEHFQKVLSELKNGFSFGGILINIQSRVGATISSKIPMKKSRGSAKSLAGFFDSHKKTASMLSPSLMPNLNRLKRNQNNNPEQNEAVPVEEIMESEINAQHARIRNIPAEKKNWKRPVWFFRNGINFFKGHYARFKNLGRKIDSISHCIGFYSNKIFKIHWLAFSCCHQFLEPPPANIERLVGVI
ncbi:MAG: hypothetical protein ABH832_03800 [bacterium]